MIPVSDRERILLGWREWVELPGLGVAAIRCKVDSGARSSALHVDAQWRFYEQGAPWVGFRLSRDGHGQAAIERAAPIVEERAVADSGGHRSVRPFLRTTLRLAGIEREIEINLTDRRGMLFPMLLGRTAMAGCFGVDPARSFLHGRRRAGPGGAVTASIAPAPSPASLPVAPVRTVAPAAPSETPLILFGLQ